MTTWLVLTGAMEATCCAKTWGTGAGYLVKLRSKSWLGLGLGLGLGSWLGLG